jgi:hypothetical protein
MRKILKGLTKNEIMFIDIMYNELSKLKKYRCYDGIPYLIIYIRDKRFEMFSYKELYAIVESLKKKEIIRGDYYRTIRFSYKFMRAKKWVYKFKLKDGRKKTGLKINWDWNKSKE